MALGSPASTLSKVRCQWGVDMEGRLTGPGDGSAQGLEGGGVKMPGIGVHS